MGAQPSGIGLGFRFPHAEAVFRAQPAVPWFEVIADDLLCSVSQGNAWTLVPAGDCVKYGAAGVAAEFELPGDRVGSQEALDRDLPAR